MTISIPLIQSCDEPISSSQQLDFQEIIPTTLDTRFEMHIRDAYNRVVLRLRSKDGEISLTPVVGFPTKFIISIFKDQFSVSQVPPGSYTYALRIDQSDYLNLVLIEGPATFNSARVIRTTLEGF